MTKIYIINFLLAISTAISMTLLAIISVDKLYISLMLIGLIEGSTEFISSILRAINGNLFDRLKNKKKLIILPVLIMFVSKLPLLININTLTILISKLTERISVGAFAGVRDPFISKKAVKKGFGISTGLCTKTAGIIVGTSLISGYSYFIGPPIDNLNLFFYIGIFITLIALYIASTINVDLCLDENNFEFSKFKVIFINILPIYIISFIFFLARFNDGILLLFLKQQGFQEWFYLSTISFFNIAMFIVSPLIGLLLDKKQAVCAFAITTIALILFNLSFYFVDLAPMPCAISGLICWGIQRAGAPVVFAYIITRQVNKEYIGTSLGIFTMITAFATLLSSIISGYIANISYFILFKIMFFVSLTTLVISFKLYKDRLFNNI